MASSGNGNGGIGINGPFSKIVAGVVIALMSLMLARIWNVPAGLSELTGEIKGLSATVEAVTRQVDRNTDRLDGWPGGAR